MKHLCSNSNEIRELIVSACSWTLTPLECLEDPGELLLFDHYDSGYWDSQRTESVLLQECPEWEAQVLLLVKARGFALLFVIDWHVMKFEDGVFRFKPLIDKPMKLKDPHSLLSTLGLTLLMKQTIKRLVKPTSYAD